MDQIGGSEGVADGGITSIAISWAAFADVYSVSNTPSLAWEVTSHAGVIAKEKTRLTRLTGCGSASGAVLNSASNASHRHWVEVSSRGFLSLTPELTNQCG